MDAIVKKNIDRFRGTAPSTIQFALGLQKKEEVDTLMRHFHVFDTRDLSMRLSVGH